MNLGMFPIAPMLLALFIPLIYCLGWKKESLRKVMAIFICCFFIVFLYRITVDLGNIVEPTLGYLFGKLILFTILPLIIILYLERCKIKTALIELGVRKDKLVKAFFWGSDL